MRSKKRSTWGCQRQKPAFWSTSSLAVQFFTTLRAHGYTTACPAEKSGQEEFDFEHGKAFAGHIEKFQPTFCKVLVRYNPEGDSALNARQAKRLSELSEYLRNQGRSSIHV